MPPVDLEALVSACAGGSCDNKVACETLAGEDRPPEDDLDSESESEPDRPEEIAPDFPPESFWLSRDAEFDWFDRNAYYERKDSTKGNSNSTSHSTNLNPSSNSNSQRFSAVKKKSKASMIGLPKTQKPSFIDPKNRKNCNARLFPKRSGSTGKSDPPMIEPGSPKVSCMGRVRSKRDRNRRLRTRQRSKSIESVPAVKAKPPAGRRKAGFFSSVRSMFRSGRKSGKESEHHSSRRGSGAVTHDIMQRLPARDLHTPSSGPLPPRRSAAEGEPPGLGGMMRFASGRRSDAWTDEAAEGEPSGLGGMMRFASGRRSDAWADDGDLHGRSG